MSSENNELVLPEGRAINLSLFVKDGGPADKDWTPAYKAEMAYAEGVLEKAGVWNAVYDLAEETFGKAFTKELEAEKDNLTLPIHDGDKLARKREANEKEGGAYKGMEVIRAGTTFNKDGDDADGGTTVYDENVDPIEPINKREVYNGCLGIIAVTLSAWGTFVPAEDYDPKSDGYGIKFYLTAFQKTGDGERLSSGSDKTGLFKKVGREEGGGSKRRSRKG